MAVLGFLGFSNKAGFDPKKWTS